ncbi:MAG: DNA replication/repair protein RecF [Ahniella sp.]|nr:DNA replication/repair protein RecF [Ahniella sp.]
MKIDRLIISHLRNVSAAELTLCPGLNGLSGANGAGKTSVLEAVYLLGYGHSFRKGGRDVIVQDGSDRATVFAEIRVDHGRAVRRIGIERSRDGWRGKLDGVDVSTLSDLFRLAPVCCFDPGSHALMSGPSEDRRALLDWGLFHVEHHFLGRWRRYQRALKQRNALLRTNGADAWFDPWEQEMAEAATELERMRRVYVDALQEQVATVAGKLCPELGRAEVVFKDGWKDLTVDDLISRCAGWRTERIRDRERGFTRRGPHRADWRIRFASLGNVDHYSRGQAKLAALCLLLAQVLHHRAVLGVPPIVLLDDLPAELDGTHQARVIEFLRNQDAQVLVTGTGDLPADRLFHVEHGVVRCLDAT